eukprot:CAMPEP_0180426868 /NCGR_PEP_ID=MMETSP1036_2-20121128/6019_1 /TAXON_ID=632150 /ORGANISM="Azadinium spinosum, Strain 3D9" /LENGTH=55 /DNA_ID=CAMNT_0022432439 /DNA_START=355 /DNA_END=522 /DNA_ORIENTATION=-
MNPPEATGPGAGACVLLGAGGAGGSSGSSGSSGVGGSASSTGGAPICFGVIVLLR